MLIKLKLLTSILSISILSYHTTDKKIELLGNAPKKNASLPELIEYYNYKPIKKDSISINHMLVDESSTIIEVLIPSSNI